MFLEREREGGLRKGREGAIAPRSRDERERVPLRQKKEAKRRGWGSIYRRGREGAPP